MYFLDDMKPLSDIDYNSAERNGVPKNYARNRYEEYNWNKRDSVSIPVQVQKASQYAELQLKAEANGHILTRATIRSRQLLGWTDEEIITTKLQGKRWYKRK